MENDDFLSKIENLEARYHKVVEKEKKNFYFSINSQSKEELFNLEMNLELNK